MSLRALGHGVLLVILSASLTTFASQPFHATGTKARTHRQWHNKPGWPAPLFKEPIPGVRVNGGCAFPTYSEVAMKHPGLVATIGEDDTETCAGIMYFGDWGKELERAEKNAMKGGARSDTVPIQRDTKRRGRVERFMPTRN